MMKERDDFVPVPDAETERLWRWLLDQMLEPYSGFLDRGPMPDTEELK